MLIRSVILDWSGTMVDDLVPVWKSTNYVLTQCGLPAMTLEEFRREFCLPIRKFYRSRTPHVPQAELERLFFAEYHNRQAEITVLPRTMDFLEFCRRQRINVFIASTVDPRTYSHQVQRFALAPYITKPYIGIEDKTEKIHHILDENRLDREQTLFVGDMEHDIEAGRAGGVKTCAVLSGYTHEERLRAWQPDLVCADLGELRDRLATPEALRG